MTKDSPFSARKFFSMDFICLAWGGLRQKRHREKRGRIFATSPLTPVTTVRLIKNCLIQALFRFTCCYDYAQFPPLAYNFEIGLFVSLPSSRIKAITSLKCLFSFQFYNNTSFAKQLIKITWLYVTFFFYIAMNLILKRVIHSNITRLLYKDVTLAFYFKSYVKISVTTRKHLLGR